MSFHRIWSKPVQNINDSPVLNLTCPVHCQMYSCVELCLICRLQSRLSFSKSVLNTSFHRSKIWMPVLFCYDLTCPDHSACLYYQMETSGFGLSWLLAIVSFNIGPKYEFVSSKTVQNKNPIPVQIRFKMPGPFCMGVPFCTVGSCRTVGELSSII